MPSSSCSSRASTDAAAGWAPEQQGRLPNRQHHHGARSRSQPAAWHMKLRGAARVSRRIVHALALHVGDPQRTWDETVSATPGHPAGVVITHASAPSPAFAELAGDQDCDRTVGLRHGMDACATSTWGVSGIQKAHHKTRAVTPLPPPLPPKQKSVLASWKQRLQGACKHQRHLGGRWCIPHQ